MGSNLSREIPLLGIAHHVEGTYFSGTKDALGMGRIRALRSEEMAKLTLSCNFVKFWARDPIVIKYNCKKIVIKSFLYKIYIL